MAPSPKDSNLEELLLSDIKNTLRSTTKHLLMQLSTATYLENTKPIENIRLEYLFKYSGKPENHYRSQREPKDGIYKWSADIVVVYNEGEKRVCEVVEVETINLFAFWERFDRLGLKSRKVSEIIKSRDINTILNDVDEVRFSIVIDAAGIDSGVQKQLIDQFRYRFNNLQKSSDLAYHNIYLLQDYTHLYNTSLNVNILDASKSEYPWLNWQNKPLKKELLTAYKTMRKDTTVKKSYKVYPLYWSK